MIKSILFSALVVMALIPASAAHAVALVGKPAPQFIGTDSNGNTHKLSDYVGKIVVLEWTNPDCPFVKKHYDSHNMQDLQENYTAKDIVWLTINSSAEGEQGHQTREEANTYLTNKDSKPTARILDASGEIGTMYDAKTTPHMFVIGKDGTLLYNGAIDDNDSSHAADAATANNYVAAALDSLLVGKPIKTTTTKPYGCSVKYKS
jgi:peroxiredoxin